MLNIFCWIYALAIYLGLKWIVHFVYYLVYHKNNPE